MFKRIVSNVLTPPLLLLALAACSATTEPNRNPPGDGNGGAGGMSTGNGGSGLTGSGTGGIPNDCGYAQIPTYREPGAMLLTFDQSSSMDEDQFGNKSGDPGYDPTTTKWYIATQAILALLPNLPQDALMGLLMFPNNSTGDYCAPAPKATVDVGPISTTGPIIETWLNPNNNPGGSVTPLAQALEASHQYLSTVNVKGSRAVLLVTDGAPSPLCGQAGEETVQVAGAWSGKGQLTFAIGLDGSAPNLMSKTAHAGGTDRQAGCNANCCSTFACNDLNTCCHYIAEGSSTQMDLSAALQAIAGSFLASCVFAVPKGDDPSKFDPGYVNVVVSIDGGQPMLVPQGTGWGYVGAGKYDYLQINDPLCADILAKPSNVEILLGCATILK